MCNCRETCIVDSLEATSRFPSCLCVFHGVKCNHHFFVDFPKINLFCIVVAMYDQVQDVETTFHFCKLQTSSWKSFLKYELQFSVCHSYFRKDLQMLRTVHYFIPEMIILFGKHQVLLIGKTDQPSDYHIICLTCLCWPSMVSITYCCHRFC